MGSFSPWAVVLAAGNGTRLRDLTTDRSGRTIPKQFCSLDGGMSLLQLALFRAAQITSWTHVTTIVAAQHEMWWKCPLDFLPTDNVVVQPCNRGTAIGVLVPLLSILAGDADPRVVLLPSDHFVTDERTLVRAMCEALEATDRHPERVVLLGMVPDEADGEFGWIVPAEGVEAGVRPVMHFVEKPDRAVAMQLMGQGALWNSFIIAARGRTLLQLFERKFAATVGQLERVVSRSRGAAHDPEALAEAYTTLSSVDFSRDVLEDHVDRLAVLPVPPCGWCDLGTPARVGRCVDRLGTASCPVADDAAAPLVLRQSHEAFVRGTQGVRPTTA